MLPYLFSSEKLWDASCTLEAPRIAGLLGFEIKAIRYKIVVNMPKKALRQAQGEAAVYQTTGYLSNPSK